MLIKNYTASIKAVADAPAGTFEALVSIFNNVDLVGDRVLPGAYLEDIDAWRASDAKVPVIFSHAWDDPMMHIGQVDPMDMRETDEGLYVKGTLDIDTNPIAAQVWRLMDRKTLKEFSFGYEVHEEHRARDGANDLQKLHVIEVGPTLKGANPETQLLGTKAVVEAMRAASDDVKHAASPRHLQAAHDSLVKAGAKCAETSSDEGKTDESTETSTKAEDPEAERLRAWLTRLEGAKS